MGELGRREIRGDWRRRGRRIVGMQRARLESANLDDC